MLTIWTGEDTDRGPTSSMGHRHRRALDPATGQDGAAHPPARPAGAARDPLLVLLARPARDRPPAAVVWQLLTYDPSTRVPVAEVARRWEPADTNAGLRPRQNITVPDRILYWLRDVLDGGATITGPAHDYAGPASWHIRPDTPDTAADAAAPAHGAAPARGAGVRA